MLFLPSSIISEIKMNIFKYIISCTVILSVTGCFFAVNAQQSDDQRFETSKNLDIFNSLFKELNMFYVDSIDAEKSINTAIQAMLEELDPYTTYYPEDRVSDLKFMTTGEYAGIGAIIISRDDKVIIFDPYEGMPAAEHGLRAGDEILEIDGEKIKGQTTTYVSDKLKGQANTKVKIKIQRPGEKKTRTFEVERKQIHVNSVPYYGVLEDNIGYIYLSTFTEQTTQEVRTAFDDLKKNHQIKALIIDLRNNGGGLMDDAIQLVNMFVPKGEVVLSTKARVKQWDRTYRTTQSPVDDKIPLAILINGHSASSSEILAGALQDLDRAILVGTRTFGKGLVQSTRNVAYNGTIKLTISKYYIPSGRCIQAIDYSHKQENGRANIIPDSLTTTFYTSKGRPVKDGGGITPDFTVDNERLSNLTSYLLIDYMIFDYVSEWRNKKESIPPVQDFVFTKEEYADFKEFVKSKNFDYDKQSEKALKALKEVMEFEGYLSSAEDELKALENKLQPDLERDLDKYEEEIIKQISIEIIKRYYYQSGEIQYSLKDDVVVNKAIEILNNKESYNNTLRIEQ